MPFVKMNLSGGSFGPAIRQLRELRGYTREQLSDITKIHTTVIAALEEERLADVSDPAYAERHVRAIVSALDARPAYYLAKYRALLSTDSGSHPRATVGAGRVRRRDLFVTSRMVAFGGFVLLVGLASAYLIWQARMLQEPPPLHIASPMQGERITVPRLDVLGDTAPGATVTVNGRPAVVSPDGVFSLTFEVPRGLTTLSITARRRYGSSVTETRSVTYERETEPPPATVVTSTAY
jgi:transcriptional regulator with XRE-family HTH domain